ncbi:MAG: MBL fold metallo-hydrolase, partial [Gammaproteobacteria bacterium]
MKKFFKYLVLIIIFLIIVVQFGLRQPSIQDRLLEIAIENLAAPSSYLPEEDALTAVVCGSRAPINDPARAETC